jgi:hypothetical protein
MCSTSSMVSRVVPACGLTMALSKPVSRLSNDDLPTFGAQMSQDEKKKFADYLIDTSEGFEAARKRTAEVYGELRAAKKM